MKSDKDIKKLLEQYYNGTSSLKEEKILRKMLNTQSDLSGFEHEKQQFSSFQAIADEETLNSEFDNKIINIIENEKSTVKNRWFSFTLSGIAAGLLILIAILAGTDIFSPKHVYGTVTNPKIAFADTRMALYTVSKQLNKGLKPVKQASQTFDITIEKTTEIKKVTKTLIKLKQINKVERATLLMQSFNSVYVNLEKNN